MSRFLHRYGVNGSDAILQSVAIFGTMNSFRIDDTMIWKTGAVYSKAESHTGQAPAR